MPNAKVATLGPAPRPPVRVKNRSSYPVAVVRQLVEFVIDYIPCDVAEIYVGRTSAWRYPLPYIHCEPGPHVLISDPDCFPAKLYWTDDEVLHDGFEAIVAAVTTVLCKRLPIARRSNGHGDRFARVGVERMLLEFRRKRPSMNIDATGAAAAQVAP